MIVVAAIALAAGGDDSDRASASTPETTPVTAPKKVVTKTHHRSSRPVASGFNTGGLLGGTASPRFADGDRGKVSVVAHSAMKINRTYGESGILLIAYRNNTGAAISHVDMNATASVDGQVVATGSSQDGAIPAQVQPGEIGMDFIYFENVESVPRTGVEYRFSAETMPADTSSYNSAPLQITQATNNGNAIIGTAENRTGKTVTGPYSVTAYCFRGTKLSTRVQTYAEPDGDLAAGSEAPFTIGLDGAKCDTFAIGASGDFQ